MGRGVDGGNFRARRRSGTTVHILITLNAQMNADGSAVDALEATTWTIEKCAAQRSRAGNVRILPVTIRPDSSLRCSWQDLSALMGSKGVLDGTYFPMPTEHFGYTDAIGDPVFEGQYPDRAEENVKDSRQRRL